MSDFLRALLPNSDWVLAARNGEAKDINTFSVKERDSAEAFISTYPGREILVLAGRARTFICSPPSIEHVASVCAVGVRVELSQKSAIKSLTNPPGISFEHVGLFRGKIQRHFVAAWRFERPIPPREADRIEALIAERLNGERLKFFIPVPRDDQRQDFLPRFIEPKDAAAMSPSEQTAQGKFVRGDEDDDEDAAQEIHDNWLAAENFTFYVGRPKQAKSLAIAKTAAYITAGGTWNDGGVWTTKWFDGSPIMPHARGSVIIMENEDPIAQTKARCRAAGCDMSKVHIRKLVPHISIPAQLKEITDLAEQLGDCRMISFSPIQAAIKARDSSEPVIRGECRPLLQWVTGRGIGLVGILHTTKDGKALAGSDVLFRIARCVVAFEGGVMEVRDSNIGPTGMRVPFKVETVISKGIKTARIEFLKADAPIQLKPEEVAAARTPRLKHTAACLQYAAALQEFITPGGPPINQAEVKRAMAKREMTNRDAYYQAIEALQIRLEDNGNRAEAKLLIPPPQWPAGLDLTLG